MDQLFFYYRLIFGLSFLVSLLVYFHDDWPAYLKLIPPFLFVSVIVDMMAWEMARKFGTNHALFNVWNPLFHTFYLYILSRLIQHRKYRKAIVYVPWVFLSVCAINLFFANFHLFQVGTYLIGSFLIIIYCLIYIIELFKNPLPGPLFREPSFWICCSLLYLHGGTVILLGSLNLLINVSPDKLRIVQLLMMVVNYLHYILMSVAFLCRLKLRKKAL